MTKTIYRSDVHIDENVSIGDYTIIGSKHGDVTIQQNTKIGDFCKIEGNVTIGKNCSIGDYSLICKNTQIGDNVTILPGSKIYSKCNIGNNVIINGSVSQRVNLEDNVRFFGRVAHSHRDHTLDWKATEEKSPIIKKGAIVCIDALIIGPVEIGENAYISAGEIVRFNIPQNKILYNGRLFDKDKFRGFIK